MNKKKFVEFTMPTLENNIMEVLYMNYVEMTTEEAIEVLRNSKGKKVFVAIKDLENEDDAIFYQKFKEDCESMIQEAQTVSSMCDEFVKKLNIKASV